MSKHVFLLSSRILQKAVGVAAFVAVALLVLSETFFRVYCYRLLRQKGPYRLFESAIEEVPYLQFDVRAIRPDKTKPRIVVIGDYISRHKSRKDGTSYPEALGEKLRHSFEIINTGAVFYSLPEELNLLKHKMLEYNPDLIVWAFVFNDLYVPNARNVTVPMQLRKDIFRPTVITPSAVEFLLRRHRLATISEFYKRHMPWLVNRMAKAYHDPRGRRLLYNGLAELARIQTERNVPIVFVIIPVFYNFESTEVNFVNNMVYDGCKEAGLHCINMLAIFKPYGVEAVKEDDGDIWHQNGFGNELIAEEIYRQIQKVHLAQ